ncbi:oxysterol-binding protein-related protein 4B-like [Cryptomeria japonica]|uniref:oxysterol-binding protein-related protein 4B-like n=1 Tax=Cryptomeria japonica TaxID=3369 RepID=UPI0027DA5872|nr:oxysterol-binding protein-related protein 4B-like [Cryptomeria japonica]
MATRIDSSTEPSAGTDAALTTPLSLDGELRYGLEGQRQEKILTRILNLFKCIRPGSDLTKFQLPPQFNLPKSQLQLFGESVYFYSQDLPRKCAQRETALERFNSVVAWSISTTRLPIFRKAPYNPILGETRHVSSWNLNVLLEQVSHHPPASALHATNESQKLELNWWHYPQAQFC